MEGDLNAGIGNYPSTAPNGPAVRGCTEAIVNQHGRQLSRFSQDNNLALLTSRINGDFMATPTLPARSISHPSTLDNILMSTEHASLARDCHIDFARSDLDHFPLGLVLDLHRWPSASPHWVLSSFCSLAACPP